MGKMGVNRTAGTPDSLSDNESSPYWRTPVRKPSTPASRKSSGGLTGSLPASRPQSRPGSKPPSRHGSNLSLDSTGEWNVFEEILCRVISYNMCRVYFSKTREMMFYSVLTGTYYYYMYFFL